MKHLNPLDFKINLINWILKYRQLKFYTVFKVYQKKN